MPHNFGGNPTTEGNFTLITNFSVDRRNLYKEAIEIYYKTVPACNTWKGLTIRKASHAYSDYGLWYTSASESGKDLSVFWDIFNKLKHKENNRDSTEIILYNLIGALYEEIKDMYHKGGLSSPRDLQLVTEINKKSAILRHLQNAMRVINPQFDIRS